MADFSKARAMLAEFKGDNYIHGLGVLPEVGKATAKYGRNAALIADKFPGSDEYIQTIRDSLAEADVHILGEIDGAGPNAPLEDLARITAGVIELSPDVIVSFGGGSTKMLEPPKFGPRLSHTEAPAVAARARARASVASMVGCRRMRSFLDALEWLHAPQRPPSGGVSPAGVRQQRQRGRG